MASLKKRGTTYYAQYYVGEKQVRRCLHTSSLQVAKDQLRKLESSLYRGEVIAGPTKTPTVQVVAAYVDHICATKTAHSIRSDLWYLSDLFGPVCEGLQKTGVAKKTRRGSGRSKRKPERLRIQSAFFEHITVGEISELIERRIREDGIAPKTANRYREVLSRMFSWSTEQRGVRMPGDQNPALKVERQRESAPEIRFLTQGQIAQQLEALSDHPVLQTMVAVYIYAGLRREELLWLQLNDVDLTAGVHGVIRVHAKTVGKEFWEPKTKRNRAVPISRALRAYLDAYQHRVVPGHWLFATPQGCRWDGDNFSHTLYDANKKAHLSWTCLDYRHTFGSQLAMKGESLYKISALMGNSPEICRRHYAALLPEALVECVEFADEHPPTLRIIGGKP